MPLLKKYPIFLIAICWIANLSAQEFPQLYFENITTEEGLSNNTITCLFQDKNGFLWIGTTNGLNKYDGNNFQKFYSDDHDFNSLSGNSIVDIIQDSKGIFWIATRDGGITRYDPSQQRQQQFMRIMHKDKDSLSLPSNRLNSIFDLDDEYILFSTESMSFGFLNKETLEISFAPESPDSMKIDILNPKNAIKENTSGKWVHHFASDDQYIYVSFLGHAKMYIYDKKTFKPVVQKFDAPFASGAHFCVDGDRIWYASWGKGFYVQENYKPGINQPLKHQQVLNMNDEVTHVEVWNNYIVFAATKNSGIYMVDKNNFNNKQILHDRAEKNSLASNRVICMLKDRNGIWWMGTNQGLSKYNPSVWQFSAEIITDDFSEEIGHYSISEINNVKRICTTKGIYKKTQSDSSYKLVTLSYNNIRIDPNIIVPKGEGTYFLCTENSFFEYDPETEALKVVQPDHFNSFSTRGLYTMNVLHRGAYQVRAMQIDTLDGNIIYLLGTLGWGLGVYDTRENNLYDLLMNNTIPNALGNNMVRVIYKDPNKDYWIGTAEGLYKWNISYPVKNDFVGYKNIPGNRTSLSHNSVSGIYRDSRGVLWISTNRGLNSFDGKQFTQYFPAFEGSSFMYGINTDAEENLWIGVPDGFEIFNIYTHQFKHISIPNTSWALKYPAEIFRYPDGKWTYGAGNYLVSFYPDRYIEETSSPKIFLNSFSLFDEELYETENFDDLRFKHDENFIRIRFSALQLSQPETVKFRYRLQGMNDIWTDIGDRGDISFTSLLPGNYTLIVQVTNPQGKWNEGVQLVQFSILKPYWQQWWFFVLCALTAILIFYAIIRYREYQLLKLQSMRNKIANDLHDDVGSALSTINVYSEVAKMKSHGKNEELDNILDKISDTSIQMQENMSHIVWSLQPRNDSFDQMLLRMKSFA
ncbi:MAG: two-component regulator propeller domain-containing protein, partial [Chitinophagales bacterium]